MDGVINSLSHTRNRLLGRLTPEELERIEPYLELAPLVGGQLLAEPGVRMSDLWFPESGFASVVLGDPTARGVEIGLIGREGAIGFATALGLTHALHHVVVQQEGTARRVGRDSVDRVFQEAPALRRLVARFAAVMLIQVGELASANARGRLRERLARWLLMAHDRSDGDTLQLVHRYLAQMLAVRRAGVTDALHVLEGEGLIRAERGRVTIRNRQGLERAAADLYGFSERSYRQIIEGGEAIPL